MISFALLVALAAQAASPYPSTAVLTAFGELCRPVEDLDRTAKAAASAGWTIFTPDRHSPIGRMVEFGNDQARKLMGPSGSATEPVVLRRRIAGEDLVAVLSGVRTDGMMVNGCRVYDLGERRRISAAEAQRWSGRAPTKSAQDDTVSIMNWEPGYAPGHDSFEVYYVPAGSPVINFVKVDGLVLKADFVGVEK